MKGLFTLLAFCLILSSSLSAQIRWQTTRIGAMTGNCQLISNKLTITVNSYYADVVEEAEILTEGSVWTGDPKSLEILGDFTLSNRSALRSMLLWNNDTILKAKLLERADADSAYENVVDRTQQKTVVRDPAIIQYLGDNQYTYRIYPVEINNSRKIRILYTVPLQIINGAAVLKITPAFSPNSSTMQTLSVDIQSMSTSLDHCILQHSDAKRTISFGSTYSIPLENINNGFDFFGEWQNGIVITPVFKSTQNMYMSKIDSGAAKGYYYAIISNQPDTLSKRMKSRTYRDKNMTLETKLTIDSRLYVNIASTGDIFTRYLKTTSPWDSCIVWNCYDNENGALLFSITQKLINQIDSLSNKLLPLIWARMNEQGERLGALYGYVDYRMSLLALDSDKLDLSLVSKYALSGVPDLNPSEIIISSTKKPIVTDPNSNNLTKVKNVVTRLPEFKMHLIKNTLNIQFTELFNSNISAILARCTRTRCAQI